MHESLSPEGLSSSEAPGSAVPRRPGTRFLVVLHAIRPVIDFLSFVEVFLVSQIYV